VAGWVQVAGGWGLPGDPVDTGGAEGARVAVARHPLSPLGLGPFEAVIKSGAGALCRVPPLPLRARVSVSCTDLGVPRAACLFPSAGGCRCRGWPGRMKVLYERVAGIDVHMDMIKVGIRSPGDKPWTRKSEVLEYRTFTGCCSRWPLTWVSGALPRW
jgi:hypothetical protein